MMRARWPRIAIGVACLVVGVTALSGCHRPTPGLSIDPANAKIRYDPSARPLVVVTISVPEGPDGPNHKEDCALTFYVLDTVEEDFVAIGRTPKRGLLPGATVLQEFFPVIPAIGDYRVSADCGKGSQFVDLKVMQRLQTISWNPLLDVTIAPGASSAGTFTPSTPAVATSGSQIFYEVLPASSSGCRLVNRNSPPAIEFSREGSCIVRASSFDRTYEPVSTTVTFQIASPPAPASSAPAPAPTSAPAPEPASSSTPTNTYSCPSGSRPVTFPNGSQGCELIT